MKPMITGARGLLGYELNTLLETTGDKPISNGRERFDITDKQVIRSIEESRPDIVFHCAAMTNVDGCEQEPKKAKQVNEFGTEHIAKACKRTGAKMVYISTDYVFDGKKTTPYLEQDTPNPINVYGRTKLAGEEIVKELLDQYIIVRTAWLFGQHGDNFVKKIRNLAKERHELKVVDDQIGSPTYTKDLAGKLVELAKNNKSGIYHLVNKGAVTWCDFAREIILQAGLGDKVQVHPASSAEIGRPASRPPYSVLASERLKDAGIEPLRDFREALTDYLAAGMPEEEHD